MPFVDGCTLEDAAARLPLAQRLAVVADVCRSVAAAHDRGIVHCDINPRNVLVAPVPGGLRSWLIDFGIAEEMARRETTSGHVFGTPAYMAPEQALGRWWEIDPRTDVYGLGATLYELASGRRPFSAETSEALLDRAVRDEPRPLAALAPGVSPRLERAVLACLAKEPARRYPSARALASELDRLAAS
jgi:serine/threonine-protein kinase